MIIKKTYKFKLLCNTKSDQIAFRELEKFTECTRFIWNYFVKLNKWRLQNKYPIMRYFEMIFWCTFIKKSEEYGFLNDAPASALQQKLRNLDQAYKVGFDKKQHSRLPVLHNNQKYNSFRIPQSKDFPIKKITDTVYKIGIPKVGWVRFRTKKTTRIEGIPKNMTVRYKAGKWYISIQVDTEVTPKKDLLLANSIGIYMGSADNFAVCSIGEKHITYPVLDITNKLNGLIRQQRILSTSRLKFSHNWDKLVLKIEKKHDLINLKKTDFLQQLSTEICNQYDYIFIEALHLKDTVQIKKSKHENKESRQEKAEKNKYILTQAWGTFIEILTYKSNWYGNKLVIIDKPISELTLTDLDTSMEAATNILTTGMETMQNSMGINP